ncbi:MAG: serine/threonine protein kinase [Myxococcaceae bacterium]
MSLGRVGKYELVRKLATGGMAEVFLAKSEGPMGFRKNLVVKRVLPHLTENPLFTSMFLAEARVAARLDHPNVVQVFDFGEVDGVFYLAMEHIDGPNLRTLIHRSWKQGTPPPFPLCAKVASLACEGLSYAHSFRDPDSGELFHLVHRDISPENIIVSRSGAVKVVDFGIAKVSTGIHITKTGIVKGKIAYMPPEQLARGALDQRVDVFALGMVLYELLTGTTPFSSNSELHIIQMIMGPDPILPVADKRPSVPEALQQIVGRALQKHQNDRYADCRAFQRDLDNYIASTGTSVSGHVISEWVRSVELPPQASAAKQEASPGAVTPMGWTGALEDTAVRPATPAPNSKRGTPAPLGASDAKTQFALTRDDRAPAPRPPRRWSDPPRIAAGALVLLVLLGGLVWVNRRRARGEPSPTSLAPVPFPANASPPLPKPPALTPALPSPEILTPPLPPPVLHGPEAKPTPPRVSVEFRIRPYAEVTVDGKLLGQTPFGPVRLSPGTHRVGLVNRAMKKSITLQIQVPKQKDFILRYNLADE